MSKVRINYNGFDLDITYDAQPPDDSVGFKGEFSIEEILWGKEDLTELLEPQIDDVEKALIEYLNEMDD